MVEVEVEVHESTKGFGCRIEEKRLRLAVPGWILVPVRDRPGSELSGGSQQQSGALPVGTED